MLPQIYGKNFQHEPKQQNQYFIDYQRFCLRLTFDYFSMQHKSDSVKCLFYKRTLILKK